MWTMPSTYNKREPNISDKHIEKAANKYSHCPLPLEQKWAFADPNVCLIIKSCLKQQFLPG